MTNSLVGLRRAGFLAQSTVLAAALLLSYLPIGWLAGWLSGSMGLAAAGVATVLCFVGAEVALIVCHLLRPTPYSGFGFTAGMLPRMGIPLVFGLFCQVTCPPVANAGLLLYLVAFYLVGLTVETTLSLPVPKDTPLYLSGPTLPKSLTHHGP